MRRGRSRSVAGRRPCDLTRRELRDERNVQGELVRVLRIADDVAAPVRVAPPANRIRLDVGRGPRRTGTVADMAGTVALHAGAPGCRELGEARDRAWLPVRTCEID